jgi:hypothetical protein
MAEQTLVEQTLVEQTLVEQTLVEQTLVEQTLVEQTLVEQTFAIQSGTDDIKHNGLFIVADYIALNMDAYQIFQRFFFVLPKNRF